MKLCSTIALSLLTLGTVIAQTPSLPSIKGELIIKFDTRTQLDGEDPRKGVTDKYKIKVNVSDSVVFDGTIEHQPFIKKSLGSNQVGALIHNIDCLVLNPKNITQSRNIGRLFGTIPIDEQNVYRFTDGNLKIGIFGAGSANGFESKVSGLALGKPPAQTGLAFWNRLKNQAAITFGREVAGKTVTISVSKYDIMEFQGHVLSAGPVLIYPEVTLNGQMVYDYDRTAWYFKSVTASYVTDAKRYLDTLTGNIRWVESPNRKVNGEGEYQFDIRVNEPPPSEASVFAGPADESAFFSESAAIPSLKGTMKYKDTITNGQVTASVVTIDLKGEQLTKQQTMYFAKMLLMSCVVPLNAE